MTEGIAEERRGGGSGSGSGRQAGVRSGSGRQVGVGSIRGSPYKTSPKPQKKARTQSLTVGKPTDSILDTPTRRKHPGVESCDHTEEEMNMHLNY